MRKAITKQDALAVAYYIAEKVAQHRSVDKATASFESYRHGNWRTTSYTIQDSSFYIFAQRTKHFDGRIRDAANITEGLINFAVYAVKNYPDIHPTVRVWRNALKDRKLVAATIDDKLAQKIFADMPPPPRYSIKNLSADLRMATTLGVLSQ